jgi:hypothetical protein
MAFQRCHCPLWSDPNGCIFGACSLCLGLWVESLLPPGLLADIRYRRHWASHFCTDERNRDFWKKCSLCGHVCCIYDSLHSDSTYKQSSGIIGPPIPPRIFWQSMPRKWGCYYAGYGLLTAISALDEKTDKTKYSLLYLPYSVSFWIAAMFAAPALGPMLSGFAVSAEKYFTFLHFADIRLTWW